MPARNLGINIKSGEIDIGIAVRLRVFAANEIGISIERNACAALFAHLNHQFGADSFGALRVEGVTREIIGQLLFGAGSKTRERKMEILLRNPFGTGALKKIDRLLNQLRRIRSVHI